MTQLSSRSVPTGPGSRGGMWHDPEYRRDWQRAWRRAHPEYRERDNLGRARRRALEAGNDPADTLTSPRFPRPLPSPNADVPCGCPDCSCRNTVPVVACGMCLSGLHK